MIKKIILLIFCHLMKKGIFVVSIRYCQTLLTSYPHEARSS